MSPTETGPAFAQGLREATALNRRGSIEAEKAQKTKMMRNAHTAPSTASVPSSTAIRFVSLVLVCLTIVALGAVAYFTERGIVRSRDWVIHTYQVRSRLSDLQLAVMHAEGNETRPPLMPGGRQSQLSPQSDLALQMVDELRSLTKDNPQQQQRLNQLAQILRENQPLTERPGNSPLRSQPSPSERRRQEQIGGHQKKSR